MKIWSDPSKTQPVEEEAHLFLFLFLFLISREVLRERLQDFVSF